jgi:hypothetical protein
MCKNNLTRLTTFGSEHKFLGHTDRVLGERERCAILIALRSIDSPADTLICIVCQNVNTNHLSSALCECSFTYDIACVLVLITPLLATPTSRRTKRLSHVVSELKPRRLPAI